MAALSIVAHSVAVQEDVGKCMGMVFASLEFGACMYAQITEIWCVWGCAMWGQTSVAVRHAPMTIVSIAMGGVMKRPESGAPALQPRTALRLPYLYFGLAALFSLASVNWFLQTSWCYQTIFEWTGQLLRGDLSGFGITCINCWIPTIMTIGWLILFLGMVMISYFHVGFLSVVGKVLRVDGWATVLGADGDDELQRSKETGVGDEVQSSAGRTSSRVPSRWTFVHLVVVPGMTLGIGQAIGISYWTIAAMYESDQSGNGGIMKIAGTYLLTRMLGSVAAGFLWDAERGATALEVLLGGMGFGIATKAPGGDKGAAAAGKLKLPNPTSKLRHAVLRPFVVMMLLSQLIFALGWTKGGLSAVTVFTGFALCGFSTGAMNALVPILAAHHYGPKAFCKTFSWMMLGVVAFQTVFYNGIENTLYWTNYGKDDPDTVLVFTDDLDFKDYYNWGGCAMRSACYRVSFWIQAAALLVPVYMCGWLESEEGAHQLLANSTSGDAPAAPASNDAEEGTLGGGGVDEEPDEISALLGGLPHGTILGTGLPLPPSLSSSLRSYRPAAGSPLR